MSISYNKTNWVNEVTPLDANNMNNIENGIESLVTAMNAGGGATITVDDTLSDTSTNPVQNKVIKAAIDAKQNTLTPSVDYVVPSEITDFITKSVDDLINYYKKTETYTQTEINQMISAIPKFSISVVDELPTTDISDTTIYLVKTGESSQNLYTEYIYVNNAWEELGTQSVDLTGYAKETWVTTQLGSYRTSAAQDEIDKKFVEKVTGKGLSTNDYTTEEKTKLAGLSNYDDAEIKTELNKKVNKPDTIEEGVLCYNTSGKEIIRGLTGSGVSVEIDSNNIPDNNAVKEYIASKLDNKVDKVSGKGLSTNDFDNRYKLHVDALETNFGNLSVVSYVPIDDDAAAAVLIRGDGIKNELDSIKTNVKNKVDKETGYGLSKNNYDDDAVANVLYAAQLKMGNIHPLSSDDEGLILHKPKVSVTASDPSDPSGESKDDIIPVDSEITSTSTGIPSTTAVYNAISSSKTVVDSALSDSSTNPVQNKVLKAELDSKLEEPTNNPNNISVVLYNPNTTETMGYTLDSQSLTTGTDGLTKIPNSYAVSTAIQAASSSGTVTWASQLFDVSTNKYLIITLKASEIIGKTSIKFTMYGTSNVFYTGEIIRVAAGWAILVGWKNVDTTCNVSFAGGFSGTTIPVYTFTVPDTVDYIRVWYDPAQLTKIEALTTGSGGSPITDKMTKIDAE